MFEKSAITIMALVLTLFLAPAVGVAQEVSGTYRGVSRAVRFDISPPLRSIPSAAFYDDGRLMVDPEVEPAREASAHVPDPVLQREAGSSRMPGPIATFDGPSNLSYVSPPDSVGDVGPDHYVAMTNLSFAVYSKDGTLEYGPVANNTLWAGFGGDCQSDNDGDPVVLYDQLADRWLLTQFTASGPTYYNCVALSTSGDPMGTYYRWAFSTGSNFPDYPKYGIWPDAYYIATREFSGDFAGIGAYAVDRDDMLAGEASPRLISFLVPPTIDYQTGDGLLPADLDGMTLPPEGSPNYWVGSMDDGGRYDAPQDALTFWEYHADFDNPPASTFNLVATIPTAAFDSEYPCSPGARDCISQPGTGNKIDIQSYRQRVIHRLAYRNFGTHESLVTNQSVEAAPSVGGIRWYEIRNPGAAVSIYQQGTYGPGVNDGIHRWMGSIAMDGSGNIGLGYSASSSSTYPSVWYTGRLSSDPLGTMPQGEGSIIDGTGSQTGSDRWGDYSSMNIDPVDDCTFWYVNEYLPTTSGIGWRLRVGAFKFDQCGEPDFTLEAAPEAVSLCAGSDVVATLDVGILNGFSGAVTLSVSQNLPGASSSFSPNPVTPPGSSVLTISDTGAVPTGLYTVIVDGEAFGSSGHSANIEVDMLSVTPEAPTLVSPPDGADNQPEFPTFSWVAGAHSDSFTIEIATDAAFTDIVETATLETTSYTSVTPLDLGSRFYWRVRADNICGTGMDSSTFSFLTVLGPGQCPPGLVATPFYSYGFEAGPSGWTSNGTGNTWGQSSDRAHTGVYSWKADASPPSSDQRLVSPAILLPADGVSLALRSWSYQSMQSDGGSGCFDGGILEISTDGTNWTQIDAPDLLTDPYDGPVKSVVDNPLGAVQAWCGDPQDWTEAIVDLDSYAGETVQFRYRLGSDASVYREGWYVDDVVVQSCEEGSGVFADGFEGGDTSAWSVTYQ